MFLRFMIPETIENSRMQDRKYLRNTDWLFFEVQSLNHIYHGDYCHGHGRNILQHKTLRVLKGSCDFKKL